VNIGLNAMKFFPGRIGGVETYFRNLINFLPRIDCRDEYTIFCESSFKAEFPVDVPRFQVTALNYSKGSLNWLLRGVIRNTFNADLLKNRMERSGIDVIHHPFSVVSPPGMNIPTVVTFWDMLHEFYPDFFGSEDLRSRTATFRSSVQEATRVIVSAEFTKGCLVERYGIDAGKIDVIYTGFGSEYRVYDNLEMLEMVRKKYGLNRPFMYYPAATWPHKNHKRLLAALKLMKDRYHFDGELILTGIAMQAHDDILAEIAELGLEGEVRVLGYLPQVELPYIYNLARLLVFPSLFEGFGIPLVEAMACGCPITSSNVTSIPEVVGAAGIMFEPNSHEDMADKVWSLWSDESKRQRMRILGLERAKLFNWEETARKTLAVYRKAVGAWGLSR